MSDALLRLRPAELFKTDVFMESSPGDAGFIGLFLYFLTGLAISAGDLVLFLGTSSFAHSRFYIGK